MAPQARAQRAALTVWSPEQLADAATLVDAHDRLGDEWCNAEDTQAGMVVEAARPVVQRDRVGDADLVDGRLVEAGRARRW